eukprot:TRINITY_DN15281_c0_g2_i1.p1 TRINITY_DN15281_c0_g2~~TRINITY_DN15281_c0_g2_i1.p1  ORF type:complete len:747 (-),score=105.66 TRINITY_DN15281_c0_g2_i1:224-2464(-)
MKCLSTNSRCACVVMKSLLILSFHTSSSERRKLENNAPVGVWQNQEVILNGFYNANKVFEEAHKLDAASSCSKWLDASYPPEEEPQEEPIMEMSGFMWAASTCGNYPNVQNCVINSRYCCCMDGYKYEYTTDNGHRCTPKAQEEKKEATFFEKWREEKQKESEKVATPVATPKAVADEKAVENQAAQQTAQEASANAPPVNMDAQTGGNASGAAINSPTSSTLQQESLKFYFKVGSSIECFGEVPREGNKRLHDALKQQKYHYDVKLCSSWEAQASQSIPESFPFSSGANVQPQMLLKMEPQDTIKAFDTTPEDDKHGFISEKVLGTKFYEAYVQRVTQDSIFAGAPQSLINPYYFYYSLKCRLDTKSKWEAKDFVLVGTSDTYLNSKEKGIPMQLKHRFDIKPNRAIPEECHNKDYKDENTVEGYLGDYLKYQRDLNEHRDNTKVSNYPSMDLQGLYFDVALLAAYKFIDYSFSVSVYEDESNVIRSIGIRDVLRQKNNQNSGYTQIFLFSGFLKHEKGTNKAWTTTQLTKFSKYPLQFYCLTAHVSKDASSKAEEAKTNSSVNSDRCAITFANAMPGDTNDKIEALCGACMMEKKVKDRLTDCVNYETSYSKAWLNSSPTAWHKSLKNNVLSPMSEKASRVLASATSYSQKQPLEAGQTPPDAQEASPAVPDDGTPKVPPTMAAPAQEAPPANVAEPQAPASATAANAAAPVAQDGASTRVVLLEVDAETSETDVSQASDAVCT